MVGRAKHEINDLYIYTHTHACTQAHTWYPDIPTCKRYLFLRLLYITFKQQRASGWIVKRHQNLQLCRVENIQRAQSLDLGNFPILLSSLHPARKDDRKTPTPILYFTTKDAVFLQSFHTFGAALSSNRSFTFGQFITATARRRIECRSPGEVGVCRSVNPIQWCTLRLRLTLPSEFCENGNYTTNRLTISWIIISCGQVIGTWPVSGREKRRLGRKEFLGLHCHFVRFFAMSSGPMVRIQHGQIRVVDQVLHTISILISVVNRFKMV